MSRTVVRVYPEKKDFLISQTKAEGKSMAQLILDLMDQNSFQRQAERHNEALFFTVKSILVWEYFLFACRERCDGKKVVQFARFQAQKLYQSISGKSQISEDISLFYFIYANEIFWSIVRFCSQKIPPQNTRDAIMSNFQSFCRERFDASVADWFLKHQICPLEIDFSDEKKIRWEIRLPDESKNILEKKAEQNGQQLNEFVVQILDSYCLAQGQEKILEIDPRERLFTFLALAFAKGNELTWLLENRNTIVLEAQEMSYQVADISGGIDWLLLLSVYSWCLCSQAVKVRPVGEKFRQDCFSYVEEKIQNLNLEPRLHLEDSES